MIRASKYEYALAMAYVASMRSEDPYTKVGAVAMTSDGRIIATGYNGLPAGYVPKKGFWDNRDERLNYILHAEVNCCSLFRRGDAETLASTLLPCRNCANTIAAAGIKRVIYGGIYKRDALSLDLFKSYGIEVIQLDPDLIKFKIIEALNFSPVPLEMPSIGEIRYYKEGQVGL